MSERPNLYIFGWPSFVGGADTKLHHLLRLLQGHFEITLVPNSEWHLYLPQWIGILDRLRIQRTTFDRLPERLEGIGLALCNDYFFVHQIAHRAKEKGLTIIWSGEMMYHHAGELEAVKAGVIDKVLYVSELQQSALKTGHGDLPSHITGNYIDPEFFPFKERRNAVFTIGRLSRAAVDKYPEDFPVFYERLGLPEVRFRVMAWNSRLEAKYRWHNFDRRWTLLEAEAESQLEFLHSLDLFVYPLGHKFVESWGRSTVEAMLTGCIPLVPSGHHLEELFVNGESGFVCSDFKEWKDAAQSLYHDHELRRRLSRQCRDHAVEKLCNKEEHSKIWLEALQ